MIESQRVQEHVRSLSPKEFAEFRMWFEEHKKAVEVQFEQWREEVSRPAKSVAECLERLRRSNQEDAIELASKERWPNENRLRGIVEDQMDLPRLEQEVQRLSMKEYQEFRRFISSLDSEHWDQRLECDIEAGKLDGLCDESTEPFLWLQDEEFFTHLVSSQFRSCIDRLTPGSRGFVQEGFECMSRDLYDADYDLRRIGNFRCVTFWFGFRAIARESQGRWTWLWIGTRAEYEGLVS